jgi:hypothetical protein
MLLVRYVFRGFVTPRSLVWKGSNILCRPMSIMRDGAVSSFSLAMRWHRISLSVAI